MDISPPAADRNFANTANAVPDATADSAPAFVVPQIEEDTRRGSVQRPNDVDGATPDAVVQAPGLGYLGMLPSDVFSAFLTQLPLDSVAVLGTTSRALADIVNGPALPFATVLPEFARAWTDDVSAADVVGMIERVLLMPLPMRASALRALACCLMVRPQRPPDAPCIATQRWAQAFHDTRALIVSEIDENNRPQMLADLEVAVWHTLDFIGEGSQTVRSGCWERLKQLPHYYWPDVLDAAMMGYRALDGIDIKAIINDASICFPHMSDKLAIAFAESTWSDDPSTQFDVMQARLGVTTHQYACVLRPHEAARIVTTVLNKNRMFGAIWRQYCPADPVIVELAEDRALRAELPRFQRTGSVREPLSNAERRQNGDLVAANDAADWERKFATYFHHVESHAATSALNVQAGDAPDRTSLYDAFVSLFGDMSNWAGPRACFDAILAMPAGWQPVLIEAMTERALTWQGVPDHAMQEDVSRWAAQSFNAFMSCHEPMNAARTCLAELCAAFALTKGDPEVCLPVMQRVTYQVFELLPSETWGGMLGYLRPSNETHAVGVSGANTRSSMPIVDRQAFLGWIEAFLRNPHAGLAAPSGNNDHFFFVVARLFPDLPDKGDATVSKYDRLCTRICVPDHARWRLTEMILEKIAEGIPANVGRLKLLVRRALTLAGFHDDDTFRAVLWLCRAKGIQP